MAEQDGTRYLIFKAVDETLLRFEYVGDTTADNAEHALRLFYKEPPETERVAVAVAASRWQPRPVKERQPRTAVGAPLDMPSGGEITGQESLLAPAPEAEGANAYDQKDAVEAAAA